MMTNAMEKEQEQEEQKEITGKITKVDPRGFGFIISHELPFTRIFFHWTSLKQGTKNFKELQRNMRVRFVPQEIPEKGYRAIRISVIEE